MPLILRNLIFLNDEVYDLNRTVDSIHGFRMRHSELDFPQWKFDMIIDEIGKVRYNYIIDYDNFIPDVFEDCYHQVHQWFYRYGVRHYNYERANESEDAIESDDEVELVERAAIDDPAFVIFIDTLMEHEDILSDTDE